MIEGSTSSVSVNFIIGMGRSGTSLLTSILDTHSNIYTSHENNFLLFLGTYLNAKKEFDLKDINYINKVLKLNANATVTVWKGKIETKKLALTKEEIVQLIYMSSSISEKNKEVKAIYDKNPEFTVHVHTLQKILPNSKYIAITRNYLDNIASRKKFHTKTKKRLIKNNWFSIYLLAISWVYYNKKIIRLLGKEKVYHIRYEDLVDHPVLALKELFCFIELPYEENILNYHRNVSIENRIEKSPLSESEKSIIREMHGNLEKPIFNKRVGVWQEQLTKRERFVCDVICRKTAEKLGYSEPKEYSLLYQISISLISLPYKLFYHSYFLLKNLVYYKLPLSIRTRFFT